MRVEARPGVDVGALARLEEEREFLLQSLRDLEREREAGDIDDADYARLRDDYTTRAAATLRASLSPLGSACSPPARAKLCRARSSTAPRPVSRRRSGIGCNATIVCKAGGMCRS